MNILISKYVKRTVIGWSRRKHHIWNMIVFASRSDIQDGAMHQHYTELWLKLPGPH